LSGKYDEYLLKNTNDGENILHICGKRAIKNEVFDLIWKELSHLKDADERIKELLRMEDVEGNLPIQAAVRFNNEYIRKKVFDYMDEKGLDEKIRFQLIGAAAFQASKFGNLEMLKLCIPSDNNEPKKKIIFDKLWKARFNNEYTYLHVAAEQGNFNIF
jgi:hypothetical protein